MELPAESERSWYPCSTTTEQTGDTERPVSRISNRSVFSSPNSTLSSLDISVYRSRKSRISKDDVEEAELQIMVDGEPINFSELDIPQPDCLNSANLMTCISKQTKVLEAAVRELRGELSTSKHLSSSSSSSKGQPGGSNDFLSASKEAAVLSDVSKQCAVTLKHIKGFYDQTRYLKGLINRMEADLAWRCRKNGESDRLRNISLAAVAAMGLACCLAYYLNQTYPDEVKTWACFTGLWMKTFLVGKFDAMSKFLKRSPIPQHVKPTLTTATP